jgi:hypothetical protein
VGTHEALPVPIAQQQTPFKQSHIQVFKKIHPQKPKRALGKKTAAK